MNFQSLFPAHLHVCGVRKGVQYKKPYAQSDYRSILRTSVSDAWSVVVAPTGQFPPQHFTACSVGCVQRGVKAPTSGSSVPSNSRRVQRLQRASLTIACEGRALFLLYARGMAACEKEGENEASRRSSRNCYLPASLPTGWGKSDDEGITRLGHVGEVGLVFLLFLTVLYLFAFSHGNSQFSRPLKWPGQGWAKPREEARNWAQQHLMFAARAAENDAELLFYGDRVFELWRGTVHMEADPRAHGVPEVFHEFFGRLYKTAVFAISGDATEHLMWRLQNGEAPTGMTHAKLIVVHVGSSDLTYASFQGDGYIASAGNSTADHIIEIAGHLRSSAPNATILLSGLLPRGDQTLMPDPAMFVQPSKFSSTIEGVNTRLHEFAAGAEQIDFLDCGLQLVLADRSSLNRTLMPDALHPSASGMRILADCLRPVVAKALTP